MPLLANPLAPPPSGPGPGGTTTTPTTTPPAPPPGVGTIRVTWTAPDGSIWDLSNPDDDIGWFTRPEIAGWGAAPYEFTTDALPRGGDDVRAIRAAAGRLTWPLHIFGDTHMDFVNRYRALRRAFLMTVHRGQTGTLQVMRPDGTARRIDCFYESGWGGEPGENWLWANPALTLYCPDGYWRDLLAIEVPHSYMPGGSYLNPYPRVSSSQVLGPTNIFNPGDVTAWPTITIIGPGSAVTATNNTTGETWTLTFTLAGGQAAVVTTAPRPTVRGPAGQNLSTDLNWPTCSLWGLQPGDNDVSLTVSGAGAGTKVNLEFFPRYDGA